ncbi:hypothetical protein GOP47_0010004 [Adiantum capillus-veneris]|uniref:J domain-containing protein n=1 Tax=Adiantum capillus-veneris TaxID=13818 RepID=A0A9D4UXP7_ADICA|nr:hypothetical protein GOP47_0010004 [Adiantum capillus-veneris]
MECNRDEALRSLSIAEQMFLQHDLLGAKKFALKAQCLFPDLEGLPQLLAVLEVHIVAQQKLDGMELNWYGILQTDVSADEATIRKQYRRLALILHPDKNKALGAEAAFKLISEAWRVLSDREKKAAYDAKRSINAFDSCAMKFAKGFCNFTHFSACCQPRPADSVKKSFWTGCPSCKMQFEFLRVHENKSISCPTCSKVFRAIEIQDTDSKAKGQPAEPLFQAAKSSFSEKQSRKKGESTGHVGSSFSFHWGTHKFNAAKHAAAANATAQIVQETYETVRRERIKTQREARQKAAMARMEAEIEVRRRTHKERKQRRKERQEQPAKGAAHCSEDIAALESRLSRALESGRADTASSVPSEGMEKEAAGFSSPTASTEQKESESRIGGKGTRLDPMQESFRCRVRNSFDSTNSYDSSEAFSFSKRLKVDV